MALRLLCLAAVVLALAGCDQKNRPTMNPGEDCMDCHRGPDSFFPNPEATQLRFTAAGTVYPTIDAGPESGLADVHVLLMDQLGKKVVLTSNSVGNFYTLEPLELGAGISMIIEYKGVCRGMRDLKRDSKLSPEDAGLYLSTPRFTYKDQLDVGAPSHPATLGIGCNHCHSDQNLVPTNEGGAYGRLAIPQFYGDDGGNEPCPPELQDLR
jgi:hypothetical protein